MLFQDRPWLLTAKTANPLRRAIAAPGIISDLTDVDTDVLSQCICSELRVVYYYKDRQHIDIKSARNLESVESFIDDME